MFVNLPSVLFSVLFLVCSTAASAPEYITLNEQLNLTKYGVETCNAKLDMSAKTYLRNMRDVVIMLNAETSGDMKQTDKVANRLTDCLSSIKGLVSFSIIRDDAENYEKSTGTQLTDPDQVLDLGEKGEAIVAVRYEPEELTYAEQVYENVRVKLTYNSVTRKMLSGYFTVKRSLEGFRKTMKSYTDSSKK